MANFDFASFLDQVNTLQIREFGVHHDLIGKRWKRLESASKTQNQPIRLIVSLDNSDVERVFLQLLLSNPSDILSGMQITQAAIGAVESILYLPREAQNIPDELITSAEKLGIRIIRDDFCDPTCYPGAAFHHLATMVVLASVAGGNYQAGTYIATKNDNQYSPLKWVSFGTKISDLPGLSPETCKVLRIGSQVYGKNGFDKIIDEQLNVGHGVITQYHADICLVDEAEKQTAASFELSCGKCTFCREGLLQLSGFVRDITKGKGKSDYLPLILEIGNAIEGGSLCSVGQTGAAFLTGTLTLFPQEYEDHIRKKKCPAGVCTAFIPIYIDPEDCTGCGDCLDVCPVDCIEGKPGYIHMIDDMDCTKCGKCIEVCESKAIIKGAGRIPALPDRLTRVGKFKKR